MYSAGFYLFEVVHLLVVLLNVLTLVVFRLVSKQWSEVRIAVAVHLVLVVLRNVWILTFVELADSRFTWNVVYLFFEFANVFTQTRALSIFVESVHKTDVIPTDLFTCFKLIHQIVLALGVSVLLCFLMVGIESGLHRWAEVTLEEFYRNKLVSLFTLTIILPLTIYNTLRCVFLSIAVRGVTALNRSLFAEEQAIWIKFFFKFLFMYGVLTNLLYCVLVNFDVIYSYQEIPFALWLPRGIESFLSFVCTKDVWRKLRDR